MRETMMLLAGHSKVSDYKLNITKKESWELFFVKGALETVRRTDTCDREVTVYVDHGEFRGDAKFFVYPSTTFSRKADLIQEAAEKALLIKNRRYTLPGPESGHFAVESNFEGRDPAELAAEIAEAVFDACSVDGASLNAVEVFLNKYTERVINSRGLDKTQTRFTAMVEAIPTCGDGSVSVELYEQYNFNSLDREALAREITGKLRQVKARSMAVTPAAVADCPVILNPLELSQLFWFLSDDLDFANIHGHSNVFSKGDLLQKAPTGDALTFGLAAAIPGNAGSAHIDSDGLTLRDRTLVEQGRVVGCHGSNRFGQYLGEEPTGVLRCLRVEPGTAEQADLETGPRLEVVSMSGLQVDLYSDYIGGEIRLGYYHDGRTMTPVTGISFSGSLAACLNGIRLSRQLTTQDNYTGPEKAILTGMKVY